jgi:hypothetical protein
VQLGFIVRGLFFVALKNIGKNLRCCLVHRVG